MRPLADEILFSPERIRERVRELAHLIDDDTPPGREIAVLVVLKGAFIFAADLVRELRHPTQVGFLEIHKDADGGREADFVFSHPFPVQGRDVLIVEDILDSGITMNALLAQMRSRKPSRLRTAVLLDKRERRLVECAVDYVGFEIPDRWVVGYGLDDDGYYRNLPGIGYIDEA